MADLDDWIQQNIFYTGIYDPQGVGFLDKCLAEGDTGRIIAFEPVDTVLNRLEQNISLDRLKNVMVAKKAIYNDYIFLKLHIAIRRIWV